VVVIITVEANYELTKGTGRIHTTAVAMYD